jgi:thymidylate synthase (FAD)
MASLEIGTEQSELSPAFVYLQKCLALEKKFENPPKIYLELQSQPPEGERVGTRDIAIATAFQCYSPGVAKIKPRALDDEKAQGVADSTLEAGHHTTRMHAYFTWKLEGVSRAVTAEVFHSYPFYNSEQQSQRYVEAREGNYLVPADLTPEQREIYIEAANYSNRAYFELLEVLQPEVQKRIRAMYPEKGWNVPATADRLNSKITKCCQEIARYALPIAQKTTYDHTLNELELLRLFRASQMGHFSDEARFIIGRMIQSLSEVDPTILQELSVPLPPEEETQYEDVYIQEQKQDFDELLDKRTSGLWDIPRKARQTLALAVRNVLGKSAAELSDTDALMLLLDPRENSYLADIYETGIHHKMTSSLRQVSVTFITKLSHTAESQRQRQRRTPGSVPPMPATYDGTVDYITPLVIRENQTLRIKYDETMANIYGFVKKAITAGIPKEEALLLLPNAHAVRVVETGDLFDWLHRWKQRLCFLAQEEICFISIEQVEQMLKFLPEAENAFLAPCGLAHKADTGKCPEGARWCGKPVWKWNIEEYQKERLV